MLPVFSSSVSLFHRSKWPVFFPAGYVKEELRETRHNILDSSLYAAI